MYTVWIKSATKEKVLPELFKQHSCREIVTGGITNFDIGHRQELTKEKYILLFGTDTLKYTFTPALLGKLKHVYKLLSLNTLVGDITMLTKPGAKLFEGVAREGVYFLIDVPKSMDRKLILERKSFYSLMLYILADARVLDMINNFDEFGKTDPTVKFINLLVKTILNSASVDTVTDVDRFFMGYYLYRLIKHKAGYDINTNNTGFATEGRVEFDADFANNLDSSINYLSNFKGNFTVTQQNGIKKAMTNLQDRSKLAITLLSGATNG